MEKTIRVVGGTDPEYVTEGDGRMNAAVHLGTIFAELRKEREDRPASDLVSTLVSARVDGHPLTDMSYTMYMLLLATAGNETTRNAMVAACWPSLSTQNSGRGFVRIRRCSAQPSRRSCAGRARCFTSDAMRSRK